MIDEEILEQKREDARAIQDMVKTDGWNLYKNRVEEEIKIEYDEIRNFPLKGKGLQEIAAEYLEHRANLNAFEKTLGFIQEFLKAIKK